LSETNKQPDTIDDVKRRQDAYEFAWKYAQLQKQALLNLKSASSASVTYTRFQKEDLLRYMQTPKANEKNIRNASIYMYDASSQYRRLISYYAHMALWAYTVGAVTFDPVKVNADTFRKSYLKAIHQIDSMNIKHEMQKASVIAFREGILYGVQWAGNNSFFIQRINPDICKLSSIVDGTWLYAVDVSQIKEAELELYPPEFTSMWNAYRNGSASKWQEVPEGISFCLKADETTTTYSIPPWASSLPMLYDIETFKSLQETASEISNYKLVSMEIPMDKDGSPQLDWDLANQYYQHLVNALPPYVGAVMAPMKFDSIKFEQGAALKDVDTVSRAEEQFWREGGTSPLLFGASDNDTAGALKLSITADEEIVLGIIAQAERLFNRILKQMSGTQKFKITILPATVFNKSDMISQYKDAATFGIPVKSAYSALLGLSPGDVMGMEYIEMNILNMGELTPLKSSHTQGDPGRPKSDDGDLGDAGEQTRDDDTNANR
jgi:hypothetical protein